MSEDSAFFIALGVAVCRTGLDAGEDNVGILASLCRFNRRTWQPFPGLGSVNALHDHDEA
jgi:hypothetical protein